MQNILIPGHCDETLELFKNIFKEEKLKVITCNQAASLFEQLQIMIPDLLIFEVRNDQVNSKMICDDFRKRNGVKKIPILITSTNQANIQHYTDFGADAGLEKPFELTDIIYKVKSLLGLNTGVSSSKKSPIWN